MLRDKDIREPLFDFLESEYGKIRIIEEKTMGKSRADIVMVTEEALYGIEIKSDADTYTRLVSQVKDYDKYYDRNYVVVGSRHAMHIREHVPYYWGVITVEVVDACFDFYVLRRPAVNPEVTWKKKLEILWRPELAQLQVWNAMPKYKEKGKSFVAGKIAERVPDKISEERLQKQVSSILFERDYTKIAETLSEYRKSEFQKKIETETDTKRQIEFMMAKEAAKANLKKKARRNHKKR